MEKTFIDFCKEKEMVLGFLDEDSFCGKIKLKIPSGEYIIKEGVFKKVHFFHRHGIQIDFTNYTKQ